MYHLKASKLLSPISLSFTSNREYYYLIRSKFIVECLLEVKRTGEIRMVLRERMENKRVLSTYSGIFAEHRVKTNGNVDKLELSKRRVSGTSMMVVFVLVKRSDRDQCISNNSIRRSGVAGEKGYEPLKKRVRSV